VIRGFILISGVSEDPRQHFASELASHKDARKLVGYEPCHGWVPVASRKPLGGTLLESRCSIAEASPPLRGIEGVGKIASTVQASQKLMDVPNADTIAEL